MTKALNTKNLATFLAATDSGAAQLSIMNEAMHRAVDRAMARARAEARAEAGAVRDQLALFFATCDPSADYAVIGETELQGEQHVVTLRFIRKA